MLNKSEFTKENLKNLPDWFYLLSVLGTLSVWYDILKEEGNCTKDKTFVVKNQLQIYETSFSKI